MTKSIRLNKVIRQELIKFAITNIPEQKGEAELEKTARSYIQAC